MIVQTRKFCLASSSPRRHELLQRYGIQFEGCSPDIDEAVLQNEEVTAYVLRLSYEKAIAAKPKFADSIILAGDTSVFYNQQILGKPKDAAEAILMLEALSDQLHLVYSAYTILDALSGHYIQDFVATEVQFAVLSSEWIRWYVETGDAMDKAGAYSFQGIGTVMVEEIKGSYNNVIGFPIEKIFWHLIREGWLKFSK